MAGAQASGLGGFMESSQQVWVEAGAAWGAGGCVLQEVSFGSPASRRPQLSTAGRGWCLFYLEKGTAGSQVLGHFEGLGFGCHLGEGPLGFPEVPATFQGGPAVLVLKQAGMSAEGVVGGGVHLLGLSSLLAMLEWP